MDKNEQSMFSMMQDKFHRKTKQRSTEAGVKALKDNRIFKDDSIMRTSDNEGRVTLHQVFRDDEIGITNRERKSKIRYHCCYTFLNLLMVMYLALVIYSYGHLVWTLDHDDDPDSRDFEMGSLKELEIFFMAYLFIFVVRLLIRIYLIC